MATLNYEWQELGSATLYTNITIKIDGVLLSQSVENNTSTISLRFRNSGSWWRTTNGTVAFTGTYTDSGSCATYPDKINDGDTIFSVIKTITHNNDGTLTISVGGTLSAVISGSTRTANISQVSVAMPTIPRGSTWNSSLLTISDINGTFKFPITKYSSSFYDTVTVKTTINDATITTFSGVNSSEPYSFNSTDKTKIFNNTTSQYPIELTLILTTYTSSSGSQVGNPSTIPCKVYIVNGEPTATYTIEEQDAKVISFLGSSTSSKIIQNASDLLFTIVVSPKNSATVKSVTVNGKSATLSSGTTYTYSTTNITTGTFNIIVTDSRNLSKTYIITKTLISYVACKINTWSVARETAISSNVVLNASISCNSASTLDDPPKSNPKVVRYKIEGGSWKTLSSSYYTLANNKITITNVTLPEASIAYTSSAKFYLDVYDVLTESKENKTISRGLPTIYYGSTDFGVNGSLYIADSTGDNKKEIRDLIYPVNSVYISTTNTNPSTLFGGTWTSITIASGVYGWKRTN